SATGRPPLASRPRAPSNSRSQDRARRSRSHGAAGSHKMRIWVYNVKYTAAQRMAEHMADEAVSGQGFSDSGVVGRVLAGAARLYPAPAASVAALPAAGVVLGAGGAALRRASSGGGTVPLGWGGAAVGAAALALRRRAALGVDRGRLGWLLVGVAFAAGLAGRAAPPLKLLTLGCATLAFAL